MDASERSYLRKEISRLRSRQADKKGILTRLDPQKDKRQIQEIINEIAGFEGEIASMEMKL